MSFLGPMHPASGVPRASFLRAKAYGAVIVAVVVVNFASGAWRMIAVLPALVAVHNFALAKKPS